MSASDDDDELKLQLEKANGIARELNRACQLAIEKAEKDRLSSSGGPVHLDQDITFRVVSVIRRLLNENQILRNNARRSRTLFERAKDVISQEKQKSLESSHQIAHLKEEMEALEFLYEGALQEKEDAETRSENLLKQLDTLRLRLNATNTPKSIETQETEYEMLLSVQSENRDLKESLSAMTAKVKELEELVDKKDRMLESQAQKCEDHLKCLRMCQEELEHQEQERSMLQQSVSDSMTSSFGAGSGEPSFVAEQIRLSGQLRDELARLRSHAATLEDQARMYQSDVEQKNAQIERLQTELEKYKEILKDVRESDHRD